ncbi:hypothetical protein FSP39_023338, partial [Pinctada imbricata]
RGKRAKKGGNKGGNNDDDEDNGDDTDLISGETEREGSAKGGRESGRGKGRGGRGRGRGQGRGRRNQHRSGDQGQSEEDDDEDDSEEDDDSDTGSVHSAVYQRSMGSGLNIASPNKRDRQFSSTDNISNAGRGRGRRGHRGQGQGRGRGGHGNMNRNTAEIESCHDEVDDLGLDENEVFEFVVKECGGMVKLSNLVHKCQLFPSGSDEARVGQWFKTHRRRFHVFQDGQEVVFVAPFFKDATYCLDYARKQCKRENCDHFHICQHYMRGTCHKGDTCPKSHSFTDDHNLEHKIKLGLDGFSEIYMCIILLNRYPQICPKRYCKEDKRCPYLHICQKFISKNCKFGENCRRGHSFDTEHNAWILNRIYHMEKWDKSEGSTFRNIISFPRRLRRRSRHGSGSSKRDDMDSLAGNLSDLSLESDSDSDSDDEPVKPDLLPRTISRKDRFKSTEQLHDTEYLRAVEVNIDEETMSEGQGKKTRKKKGRKTESRGSDMSEEEVFDASAKNRNRKDSDKSEEGGARRKDKNRREQGKSDESKNEDKESKERAKIYLDDADKTSICYNNVAGTCHIVNNCRFHHKTYGLPYLWQVKLMDKWRIFSQEENEIIERDFCNQLQVVDSKVSIEATKYKLHVCLDTELTAVVYEVASFPVQQAEHVPMRRLSTPSYAEKRANRPQHGDKRKGPTKEEEGQTGTFCTQWRWYFMDDHNRWTLFDKDGMQFTLEKKFMCNQKTYLFTRQDYNFKYKISFKEMEQINMDTGKRRSLLRRPLFVSRDDVSAKNFPQCLSVTISPGTPSHWAPLDMSGAEFELVELERTKEFTRVQDSFYATLDRQVYEIDLIYRVQNRSLWNEYFMKKKMMNEKAESEASGKTVDERDLFHGTDSLETCRKICTNSFDFRISGKNATVYGEGSYFALESDYSNRYTNKTSGSRLMFRAKVLVGKYTKGERSFKRPPEIPGGSHKLYDSCVNHTANPTIFIIFDTRQCYPEYLIQYHKKGEEMLEGDVYVPPQPRPASVSSFSNTASSSNNAPVSSRPVVPPRIGRVSTNVSSPSSAFSDPYGQVPSVSQSGVRTQASHSQGPVGQSAMQTQAHSQGPVSQSAFSTQPYSQDNSQFHGSPLDNQNVYYSRSAAEGARHTPTQTYRTASGREVPTPSYRRKEEGCVLQ